MHTLGGQFKVAVSLVKQRRYGHPSPSLPVLFPDEYEYVAPILPTLPEPGTITIRRLTPVPGLPPSLASDLPVDGPISSKFGMRKHPVTGILKAHRGVDIAAPEGAPVQTTAGGVVSFAGISAGYGNLVVVDHGHGITSYYGHLSAIQASVGQSLRRGDVIGLVGSTGMATGPHLHWEIRRDGTAVDPVTMS